MIMNIGNYLVYYYYYYGEAWCHPQAVRLDSVPEIEKTYGHGRGVNASYRV
jgi:hypothetical protein